ncbi:MAG: type II toxin-antitoxin system HigA family antitoxin [Tagaea sp.]
MRIKPIRTRADWKAAAKRASALMDSRAGTPDGDELAVLAVLIADYERTAFATRAASPREVIEFRMEQMGVGQKELAQVLRSRSRASEILSGKRATLSLTQIKRLRDDWGIPADLLVA